MKFNFHWPVVCGYSNIILIITSCIFGLFLVKFLFFLTACNTILLVISEFAPSSLIPSSTKLLLYKIIGIFCNFFSMKLVHHLKNYQLYFHQYLFIQTIKKIWIPTNHRSVKIKFHKHRLNGVHEAEPDTWISHLFYN